MKKYKVLEVNQPLGTFYVLKISAFELLQIVESKPYNQTIENGEISRSGIQRQFNEIREKEIRDFLQSTESALPNSIIIAGNTHSSLKENEEDDITNPPDWYIEKDPENCNQEFLVIPKMDLNGIVVDGQHRLFSFRDLSEDTKKKYELLCTLYLDLPTPYQAYLFATINMNQRKVSRDLAYELFGYDLNEEESYKWSPEKLAVFLTRKLNMDRDSIFRNHIRLASKSSFLLDEPTIDSEWFISTASMVEGILTLITNNSKRDFDHLQKFNQNLRDRKELQQLKSNAPLRMFYIENNDVMIYKIIFNYFNASYDLLYRTGHMLYKTIGIQVQFAVLRKILELRLETDRDISKEYYTEYLKKITGIDFSDPFFQFSGIGKTRMRNVILVKMGLMDFNEIKNQADLNDYKRFLD